MLLQTRRLLVLRLMGGGLLVVLRGGCALGMPVSEGLMFAEEASYGTATIDVGSPGALQSPERTPRIQMFSEFGVLGSYHVYTSRFDRRFRKRFGPPGSFQSQSWWRGNALMAANVALGDRIAFGGALGLSLRGDVTLRIGGPYYATVNGHVLPPGQVEAIFQRRLLYEEGYGFSAGIVGQRAIQVSEASGDVPIPFVGGRTAFQVPLSYEPGDGSTVLRGFVSAGMETRFQTPALRVGVGIFGRDPSGEGRR